MREGIFSLSRLDFILASHQFNTARNHRGVWPPASRHSSLRRLTKNNLFSGVSFTSYLGRFLGGFPRGKVWFKRRGGRVGIYCKGATRHSAQRNGARLPQKWGSDGSSLTSVWLVREEGEGRQAGMGGREGGRGVKGSPWTGGVSINAGGVTAEQNSLLRLTWKKYFYEQSLTKKLFFLLKSPRLI